MPKENCVVMVSHCKSKSSVCLGGVLVQHGFGWCVVILEELGFPLSLSLASGNTYMCDLREHGDSVWELRAALSRHFDLEDQDCGSRGGIVFLSFSFSRSCSFPFSFSFSFSFSVSFFVSFSPSLSLSFSFALFL